MWAAIRANPISSWMETCPSTPNLVGQTFFAIDDGFRRAYPIVAIEEVEGRLQMFTKRDGRGFEARPARRWELPVTVEQESAK